MKITAISIGLFMLNVKVTHAFDGGESAGCKRPWVAIALEELNSGKKEKVCDFHTAFINAGEVKNNYDEVISGDFSSASFAPKIDLELKVYSCQRRGGSYDLDTLSPLGKGRKIIFSNPTNQAIKLEIRSEVEITFPFDLGQEVPSVHVSIHNRRNLAQSGLEILVQPHTKKEVYLFISPGKNIKKREEQEKYKNFIVFTNTQTKKRVKVQLQISSHHTDSRKGHQSEKHFSFPKVAQEKPPITEEEGGYEKNEFATLFDTNIYE